IVKPRASATNSATQVITDERGFGNTAERSSVTMAEAVMAFALDEVSVGPMASGAGVTTATGAAATGAAAFGETLGTATGGGRGASDARTLDTPSSTIATNSGNVRNGRQSSYPSRQTKDSSVISPLPARFRSSAKRRGPVGEPSMPTNHSSAGMPTGM